MAIAMMLAIAVVEVFMIVSVVEKRIAKSVEKNLYASESVVKKLGAAK